jgi:hypothetical protein
MPNPKEPITPSRFKVGDKVRVKPGVTDPDFLSDLDRSEVEEHYGLIGEGKEPGGRVEFPLTEIEGIKDKTNRRLIDDYSYWLANFG